MGIIIKLMKMVLAVIGFPYFCYKTYKWVRHIDYKLGDIKTLKNECMTNEGDNIVGTQNDATRQEWIAKTLSNIPAGLRILDAGAGELKHKKHCEHLDYVSQDFCQYEGSGDGKGLQTGTFNTSQIDIVGDIINISEQDESFDVILCSEVFEHIPNPVKALEEFQRLLKRGGIMIITAPFCSLTHFAPYHFSTGFNRYFYEHHLKDLNFEIEEIETNGNFFEYLGQEVRRVSSIAEKYSDKETSSIENNAMEIVLGMLERFSKKDNGSDELLCFGYHVVAYKK